MRIQFLIVLVCYYGCQNLAWAEEDSHEFYDDGNDDDSTSFTGSEFQELEYAAVEMNHPYSRMTRRPDYSFEFGIDADEDKDKRSRSHKKTRDGHKVSGQYRVLQPDGTVRVVEYTTDPKTGNIKATVEYGRV